ncbi:MAG TPA: hypothetical protein VGL81_15990 [Polyangiaceae bacterium]|jgi:hypothetical protein
MITTLHLRMRASLAVAAAFGLVTLGGDCDGDIVQDPTFRDWCGASLCAWHLDTGTVSPVPTWNADDLGVGFVGSPTQISQATTESSATCILFTSVANIDPAADMTIAVDFNSDGSFESTTAIGATQWQKVQTEITAPAAYQGITFVVRKGGSGTAVLAEMRIQSTTGCTAAPVGIDAGTLMFGEKCADSAECGPGLTCTGVSSDMLCSQCSDSAPCAGGVGCAARSVFLPSQCGPGQGLGKTGDPCLNGSDCASGDCEGATPVALADEAGTCDLDAALGTDADATNCQWFGDRGGQCR